MRFLHFHHLSEHLDLHPSQSSLHNKIPILFSQAKSHLGSQTLLSIPPHPLRSPRPPLVLLSFCLLFLEASQRSQDEQRLLDQRSRDASQCLSRSWIRFLDPECRSGGNSTKIPSSSCYTFHVAAPLISISAKFSVSPTDSRLNIPWKNMKKDAPDGWSATVVWSQVPSLPSSCSGTSSRAGEWGKRSKIKIEDWNSFWKILQQEKQCWWRWRRSRSCKRAKNGNSNFSSSVSLILMIRHSIERNTREREKYYFSFCHFLACHLIWRNRILISYPRYRLSSLLLTLHNRL